MKLSLLVLFSALACAAAQKSIPLAPFPDMSAPRAVTSGPHDHFLANYFAINAWSPDNRYLLALETDIKDKLPDGAPCTLGLVDLEDGNRFIPVMETRAWNFQEAAMRIGFRAKRTRSSSTTSATASSSPSFATGARVRSASIRSR